MSDVPNPILMSKGNPNGYKLEELLSQIATDLFEKNKILKAVEPSEDTVREDVRIFTITTNDFIAKMMLQCLGAQKAILVRLDRIGTDTGPLGPNRI